MTDDIEFARAHFVKNFYTESFAVLSVPSGLYLHFYQEDGMDLNNLSPPPPSVTLQVM
jgi:hypothetical protein